MGNPVEHSRSPWIHQQFAQQAGLSVNYTKRLVALEQFESVILELQQQGFAGCNITVPFKEQAFALAAPLSNEAKYAGAVNTFVFEDEGVIKGYNTDGLGFIRDVILNLNYSLKNKKVVILGAGGAARGILYPILNERPMCIYLVNRTLAKAQQIVNGVEKAKNDVQAINYQQLAGKQFDVIIDTTSFMAVPTLLPESLTLSAQSLCYDLKFPKDPSPFLQWAKQKNAAFCVDGMGMVVEQAALAFKLWTGFEPQTQSVIAQAMDL